jgi:hypothetical protein
MVTVRHRTPAIPAAGERPARAYPGFATDPARMAAAIIERRRDVLRISELTEKAMTNLERLEPQ